MGAKRPWYNENTSGTRPQVFFRDIDCVDSVRIDVCNPLLPDFTMFLWR